MSASTDPIDEDGRAEDGQIYVDRSKADFDPAEGMYSGTVVDGSTEIPGPHDTSADRQGTQEGNAAEG